MSTFLVSEARISAQSEESRILVLEVKIGDYEVRIRVRGSPVICGTLFPWPLGVAAQKDVPCYKGQEKW